MIKNVIMLLVALACVCVAGVACYNKGYDAGVVYASYCVNNDGVMVCNNTMCYCVYV